MTCYNPHTHYIAFPIEMYKKKNACGLNCRYAGADEKQRINFMWPFIVKCGKTGSGVRPFLVA